VHKSLILNQMMKWNVKITYTVKIIQNS